MVWGMTLETFTLVHVLLSLIGIGAGVAAMAVYFVGRDSEGWTALFLVTTIATSVTGFGFPFDQLTALAPQQTEPPFVLAQLIVLVGFVSLTIIAVRRIGGRASARA